MTKPLTPEEEKVMEAIENRLIYFKGDTSTKRLGDIENWEDIKISLLSSLHSYGESIRKEEREKILKEMENHEWAFAHLDLHEVIKDIDSALSQSTDSKEEKK